LLLLATACLHRQAGVGPAEQAVAPRALDPLPRAVLVPAAGSLDVSQRMRALELLVLHAPEDELSGFGLRGLYDPSSYVRRRVTEALAQRLPSPAALQLLEQLVLRQDVDAYTRGMAGFSLGLAGHSSTMDALGAAWRAESAPWDRAPLALAAATMGDTEASAALSASLVEGAFPLETDFFLALGQSGLPELVPALLEARGLVEEELVLPIGVALLGLGAPGGEAIFREALGAELEELRLEALDYLILLEGPEVDGLLRKARAGGPELVRTYSDLILVGRGEAPLSVAIDATEVRDREQRCLSLDAIGRHLASAPTGSVPRRKERSAREISFQSLLHPEPAVRLCAARSLGLMARPEDRAVLEAELTSLSDEASAQAQQVELAGALLALGPASP